jgi:hypothetical protein
LRILGIFFEGALHASITASQVVKAIAFFDNRDFDEFWNRVSPNP